jgi:hypothetical protein
VFFRRLEPAPALFVTFCLIMSAAEHLAVCRARFATFALGGYVVGIHFFLIPYLDFVGILADCA